MIEIVNARHTDRGEYIGRPSPGRSGSPLANQFRIGADGDRAAVIAKYELWLAGRIRDGEPAILAEIERLAKIARHGRLVLRCWCAPERCHGDVIKAHIEASLEPAKA